MITVYSKPDCVQCDFTIRELTKLGIEHETIDVTQDDAALKLVRELGYMQAPVVVTPFEHWSGFRPDKIRSLTQKVPA